MAQLQSSSITGSLDVTGDLHVIGDLTVGKISNQSKLVDVGGNFNFDTVAEPTTAEKANFSSSIVSSAGNVDNGTHYYTVIYKTADGGETGAYNTPFLEAIITDNTTAGQVQLTGIPTSSDVRVTTRDIYRTSANGNQYYGKKLATISDNTTTTYTDNLADSSLDSNTRFYRKANSTAGYFYKDNNLFGQAGNIHYTSFGVDALKSVTIGQDNVAFGGSALQSTTSGRENTAIGRAAGVNNTTGYGNTYLGYVSGYFNETGIKNTAVGSFALRQASLTSANYNTAVGNGALWKLTSNNNHNTAIGHSAGLGYQGAYNVHIGSYTGYKSTEGSGGDYNINIGYYTGNDTTGDNNILIGRELEAPNLGSNNQLNIGNLIYATGLGLSTTQGTGNVGIGTTTPDSVLEIASSTTTDFLKLTSGGSSASPIKLIFEKGAAEQGIIEYNRNGDLEIYNSDGDGGVMINGRNSEAGDLYVADNGKVGIGTTSPDHPLHVAGNAKMSNIYLLGNIIHEGDVDTQIKFQTDTIKFDTAGSERLTITSTGNVDSTGNFTVTKGSATIKAIETGGGDVRMTAGGATGYIGTYNNKTLQLVQNGTTALFVDTSQNVGIGTTSPGSELEVNGNIEAVGNNAALHLKDSNDDSTKVIFDNLNGNSRVRYYGGNFSFLDEGSNETLTIGDSSGNVGIGTTSPQQLLDITATTTAPVLRLSRNQNIGSTSWAGESLGDIEFYTNDPSSPAVFGKISLVGGPDSGTPNVGYPDGHMVFYTKGQQGGGLSEKLRITDTGNVGIGTTSPDVELEVEGTIKASTHGDGLVLGSPTTPKHKLGVYGANALLFKAPNGTVTMAITEGAKIGIGTTSPSVGLHVYSTSGIRSESAGNASVQIMRNDNVQYSALLRYYSGNSEKWVAGLSDAGDYTGSTGEEYIIGTLKSNPLLVLKNDGKLGIGTTTPLSKLHVATSTSGGAASAIIQDDVRTGTGTLNYIGLTDSAGTTQAKIGYLSTLNGDLSFSNLIGNTTVSSTGQVTLSAGSNILLNTGGSASVKIDNTGKVGIGTTSPEATALLDVASTSKGVLFPRMTATQRTAISSPATGLIVYQTDSTEGLYIYKSTGWVQII